MKKCLICNTEYEGRTECCMKCRKRIKDISIKYHERYPYYAKKYKISIVKILMIKKDYTINDVLAFIEDNLSVIHNIKRKHEELLKNKRIVKYKNKLYNYGGS